MGRNVWRRNETLEAYGAAARMLRECGMSTAQIAEECNVSRRTVQLWLQADRRVNESKRLRAAKLEPIVPRLVPLFGVAPWTPQSKCPHHGPIPDGSPFVCMVCHQSGYDAHPDMRRPIVKRRRKSAAKFRPKGLKEPRAQES